MLLLTGIKENDARLKVQTIFNLEVEENDNIDRNIGVIVENKIEQPQAKKGIRFELYVNPMIKEQWFEEKSVSLTQEEIQEEKQEEMNDKLDLLMQYNLESEGIL